MSYRNRIVARLAKKTSIEDIALCVYTTYQTVAMKGLDDMKFDILHAVAKKFSVPINNVLIAGSAQTGESFHQETKFDPKESDLDLAIVDRDLFEKMMRATHKATSDYQNLAGFPRKDTVSVYSSFLENIGRGFFRPDLMPRCPEKDEWFNFFQHLTQQYQSNFDGVNAGIYMSLHFFQQKQTSNIEIVKQQSTAK